MKQKRSITLRLVQENDSKFGVLNITASRWRTSIKDLCAEFRTNADFTLVRPPRLEDFFYYGLDSGLKQNGLDGREELFAHHIENVYSERTSQTQRNGTGYARIPVAKLGLGGDQIELLEEVLNYYSRFLANLNKKVKRMEMPPANDLIARRAVLGQFKFPAYLGSLALQNGYYFKAGDSTSLAYKQEPIVTRTVSEAIPPKKLVLTPKTNKTY